MILGRACQFTPGDRRLVVRDPDGNLLGTIEFVSVEAASKFATAAVACEYESLRASEAMRVNSDGAS